MTTALHRSQRIDLARPPDPVLRVVVLTASIGAGHRGPATELARRLRRAGHQVELIDLVQLAPAGTGQVLRAAFRAQLSWAPKSWDRLYQATDSADDAWSGTVINGLLRPIIGRLRRILAGSQGGVASALVSTFPLAGHAAGAAIAGLGSRIPLISYVTDPAAHASWLAPGTDLYLTSWSATATDLWRSGPAVVRVVDPLIGPAFRWNDSTDHADTRRRFGLPQGPLALVISGSWGVGDISGSVADLIEVGGPAPVVVCGRNQRLRRQLNGMDGVSALGWVDDMPALMRTCDVGLLNSGGLTLAESTAIGLPVLHYRPLAGQGIANAELSDRAGIAPWPRNRQQLRDSLQTLPPRARSRCHNADPASEIINIADSLARSA